jgi:hypothetical protein
LIATAGNVNLASGTRKTPNFLSPSAKFLSRIDQGNDIFDGAGSRSREQQHPSPN